MSGAAAVNRLNDAYLARLETLARMTTNGIISVNEGKKFRAEAKKLWKPGGEAAQHARRSSVGGECGG